MDGFTEITIFDGYGEFMVHLDSKGEPIRMYTYVSELFSKSTAFNKAASRFYDEDDIFTQLHNRANFKESKHNPLFVYAKSLSFVKMCWDMYLQDLVSEEDMEQFA